MRCVSTRWRDCANGTYYVTFIGLRLLAAADIQQYAATAIGDGMTSLESAAVHMLRNEASNWYGHSVYTSREHP